MSNNSKLTLESIVVAVCPDAPLNLGAAWEARYNHIVNDGIVRAFFPLFASRRDVTWMSEKTDALNNVPQLGTRIHRLHYPVHVPQCQSTLTLHIRIQNRHVAWNQGDLTGHTDNVAYLYQTIFFR